MVAPVFVGVRWFVAATIHLDDGVSQAKVDEVVVVAQVKAEFVGVFLHDTGRVLGHGYLHPFTGIVLEGNGGRSGYTRFEGIVQNPAVFMTAGIEGSRVFLGELAVEFLYLAIDG
ncbi:MAG: hypothetical protein BWY72_01563 [Bacteroidetes bacterium ADurb.Bin416]|nr:MAG: hypothetical protein BWY72_01563 [Bacteroidetes bacterium ADurb.Bin416]